MKILFIGGTGVISASCSDLCIERGIDLYLLNRRKSPRVPPPGAKILHADILDVDQVKRVLHDHSFDVVVDWIAYQQKDVERDVELFRGMTSQYIFISSASVYQKPIIKIPITEETPLSNPAWEYSQAKIECEMYLQRHHAQDGFPVTIVRPSHTYDKTRTPIRLDYTLLHRMRIGKKILLHDDGTSLWTLTHARDFAKGIIGLFGNSGALGRAYHITSDEVLSWNRIAEILAEKARAPLNIAYVPGEFVIPYDTDWGNNLVWDKRHPGIFDNAKIKSLVPDYHASITFEQGAEEIVQWYDAHPEFQIVNRTFDTMLDTIINDYEKLNQRKRAGGN
jgi:nucleoside-diphosphate-sugar epimerase